MEYRSLSVAAFLIALGSQADIARAESAPSPEQQADWQRQLLKADELKNRAKADQLAANKLYGEQELACFKKFLVNACRDEANAENTRLTREARRLESEGKALERQVRKEQLSDKDARYIAEADERQANLRQRAAETAQARAELAESEAAERANKEKQSAEGLRRREADAREHEKKVADHQARVARKMEKIQRQSVAGEAR